MRPGRRGFTARVKSCAGRGGALAAGVLIAAAACGASASTEIMVSVQDGKQLRADDGAGGRTADTLAVIELGEGAVRVLGLIATPASLIGPPTSLALTPDRKLALVSAAQRLDPDVGDTLIQADTLSVVNIVTPSAPRLVQTLVAGPGATGVTINPSGSLALVASTGDDVLSLFSIRDGALIPVGRTHLPYQSRPTDAVFTPDGGGVLVVLQNAGRLARYAVDGERLVRTGIEVALGLQPTGVVVSRDGRFAFVTNAGGRRPMPGAPAGAPGGVISVVDLSANTVIDTVDAGAGLEHLALSPDGRFLQVTLVNGSSSPRTAPSYNPTGRLRVFSVDEGVLTPVTEAETGQWCQGAAWSRDSRLILLQCALKKQIEVYRFDGAGLERDAAATLTLDGRPAAIVGSTNR